MGKRMVDENSLTMLAEEMRSLSDSPAKLVFPNGFIAEVRTISAKQYNKGYKQGMDDFAADKNIGDYRHNELDYTSMYAFACKQSMTSATFPKVRWMGQGSFRHCTNLTAVYLPAYNDDVNREFCYGCSKLQVIDLGAATTIDSLVFAECGVLATIILRNTAVVGLFGTTAFRNTPYAEGGTGGKIYVPAALIEEYKTATNWSALYAYGTVEFVALEGSEYENADY